MCVISDPGQVFWSDRIWHTGATVQVKSTPGCADLFQSMHSEISKPQSKSWALGRGPGHGRPISVVALRLKQVRGRGPGTMQSQTARECF